MKIGLILILFLLSFFTHAKTKILKKELLAKASLEKTIFIDKEQNTVIKIKRINIKDSESSDPGFFLNLSIYKYCEAKNLGFITFGGNGSEMDASSSFKCEGKVDQSMWKDLMQGMCKNHIESKNIQQTCSELNREWKTL